jgi:hypothetical protein
VPSTLYTWLLSTALAFAFHSPHPSHNQCILPPSCYYVLLERDMLVCFRPNCSSQHRAARLSATGSSLDMTCMSGLRCHWPPQERGCVHVSQHTIFRNSSGFALQRLNPPHAHLRGLVQSSGRFHVLVKELSALSALLLLYLDSSTHRHREDRYYGISAKVVRGGKTGTPSPHAQTVRKL